MTWELCSGGIFSRLTTFVISGKIFLVYPKPSMILLYGACDRTLLLAMGHWSSVLHRHRWIWPCVPKISGQFTMNLFGDCDWWRYSGGKWNLTRITFPLVSQDTLKVWKNAIYHWKALWNLYRECKINFWNFQLLASFRGHFWKNCVFQNGRNMHEMGAMPTYFVFILHGT